MWRESIELQQNEEQTADRERAEAKKYDHDENVETTYERAQREGKEYHEEVEQEIYERDDKLGAI